MLRALAVPGAVLVIADGMEMGVVVRDSPTGQPDKKMSVERLVAQALALQDWIATENPGARICRYHITAAGRNEMRALIAAHENTAQGFAEGQARFAGIASAPAARRRDKDGTPFLSRDLVLAGERLREDFELSQIDPRLEQDWSGFITGAEEAPSASAATTPQNARARVADALRDLGPGLGDVALRCCCYLEGMEVTEKRLGWSARSGKIVLRIALQRLKRHYDDLGASGQMIG